MKAEQLFNRLESQGIWATLPDIRLETQYTNTNLEDISIGGFITKNIPLKTPFCSAAMDTVTEHKMAISLAKLGGLGAIHRGLSIQDQVNEVKLVKQELSGLIKNPVTFSEQLTIAEILATREKEGYSFHSFLIVDSQLKLVGILTENDFNFCDNTNQKAGQVMTTDLILGSEKTSSNEAYHLLKKAKKKVLPLVNDQGEMRGMYLFGDLKRIREIQTKNSSIDQNRQLQVAAAIGTHHQELERLAALIEAQTDLIVFDSAHADSQHTLDFLREIKTTWPEQEVLVGNISNPDSVIRMAKAGADGIKVGQGPGSICTTRIMTGVGRPQASTIFRCYQEAQKYNIPITADGGLNVPGDCSVALALGASCLMSGFFFAGTDESPGKTQVINGKKVKNYRGMGSKEAIEAADKTFSRHPQLIKTLVPEGVAGQIAYQGSVTPIINHLIGCIKKSMWYSGASTIEELREKSDFIYYTDTAQKESNTRHVF